VVEAMKRDGNSLFTKSFALGTVSVPTGKGFATCEATIAQQRIFTGNAAIIHVQAELDGATRDYYTLVSRDV